MEPTDPVSLRRPVARAAGPDARAAPGAVWFPALDGLRAVAALLVVVFHTSGSVAYFAEPLQRLPNDAKGIWAGAGVLARLGNWGVAIFFVLSGFLLYRPFVAAWLGGRPGTSMRNYFTRRLMRIIPAYWVALTYYLLIVRHNHRPPGGYGSYLLFYGFAQNYRTGYVDQGGGLAVAWTLCIEMSFYLVLPLLAWGLRAVSPARRSMAARVRAQLVVLAAASIATVGLRYWVISERPLQTFWLQAHFAWFGLGMMAAVLHAGAGNGVRLPYVVRMLGRFPELSWLFGLQVFWLSSLIVVRPWIQTRPELMWIFLANGISAALLLAPLVFGDQREGWLRAGLSRFPLRWLGEISYGVYLWHTIWLVVVVDWVADGSVPQGFWPRFAVVMLITFAVAHVSLVALERPLMKLVQRPTRRAQPAPAPPGPAG